MAELVGIVLVSHSERLACGLRDVLEQVGTTEVPVEVAGGTDDGRIGTSYDRIAAAIDRAERGAGVLVLTDLGSAVLTTRTVLADRATPPSDSSVGPSGGVLGGSSGGVLGGSSGGVLGGASGGSPGVVLVDAPFVEGAVAAAVLAATGADLPTCAAAAMEARDATKL